MSKLRFSRVAADAEPHEIARAFHCHYTTVYRIQKNVNLFGEAKPAPISVMGRPRKITPEALEGLLDWLLDNDDYKKLSYLDEMVYFLDEEYGISTSKSNVCRVLAKV
jgi:transposase